jgi:predicted phosphate transport protein (TIGR00153 family)
MLFDKKAKEVEALIREQFNQIGEVLQKMREAVSDYIVADKQFKQESFEVHKTEHQADKLCRKIGRMLYEGAFLPIYREDYYRIINMGDDVADQAEIITDFITLTRPLIPEFIVKDIKQLMDLNLDCFQHLIKLQDQFLTGKKDLLQSARDIRHLESDIDTLQFYTTRRLFKSNLDKMEKLHTKDLIDRICMISDLVEDISDEFEIVAAKHRL